MMYPTIRNNNSLSSWFDTAFNDLFNASWMPRMNATAPAVNVKENAKAYEMDIAAPGLKKDYCRVNLDEDGNLSVKIENKMEHKEDDKKQHYLRREFSYSNYEQTYTLPENVDKDHISAKVEDGVLIIELPKMTQEEQKKLEKKIEVA